MDWEQCGERRDRRLDPQDKTFHFPTGRLAYLFVGYPGAQLDLLPAAAPESFAGVGYPFAAGAIREGDRVLDIGSGSGTDTPEDGRAYAGTMRLKGPSNLELRADVLQNPGLAARRT